MPFHVYVASLVLGFCQYAWRFVGNTGDETVKQPFSMGCTSLCVVAKELYS
jgi:hypothetical protein